MDQRVLALEQLAVAPGRMGGLHAEQAAHSRPRFVAARSRCPSGGAARRLPPTRTLRRELETLPSKAGSGLARGERRGHVFCAKVGHRVYLRFVPLDEEAEIVDQLGTCLRIIECTAETARVLPADLRERAFGAWDQARQHIYEAWMYETDPANLQPKAPKIHREIDEFLRRTPPPGVEQKRLERALDALAAPSASHEQAQLREVFDDERSAPATRAIRLLEKIEELGLEPYQPPEPLPPIGIDEIHLVCWMGVETGDE